MPRKSKDFSIAQSNRSSSGSPTGKIKSSKMGKKKSSKNVTNDDDSAEDYPVSPRMEQAPIPNNKPTSTPPGSSYRDDDDDESEEGWSDDSGRDSDRFENEHVGGKGRNHKPTMSPASPVPPVDDDTMEAAGYADSPAPLQRSSSKSPPPPSRSDGRGSGFMGGLFSNSRNNSNDNNRNRDDYYSDDDDDDDDEEEPLASTLGGTYLSNSNMGLGKSRSRGSSFSDEDRAPMVEPAHVGNDYNNHNNSNPNRRSSGSDPPYKHDDPPESPPPRQSRQPAERFSDEPSEHYPGDRRSGTAAVAYGDNDMPRHNDSDDDDDDDSFAPSNGKSDNYVVHSTSKPRSLRDDETGDLETSETNDHRSRGFDSVAFSESEKRHRKTVTWLLMGLACALVLLAALAGALIGVFVFGNKSSSNSSSQSPQSSGTDGPIQTKGPNPGMSPTGAPTGTPACVPDAFSGITCNENSTATPTIPSTTIAPTVPGSGVLNSTLAPTAPGSGALNGTIAPTVPGMNANATMAPSVPGSGAVNGTMAPGNSSIITDQALYNAIAALSADSGAAIMQEGTPQSQAFTSVQSEALPLDQSRLIQRYAMRTFFYSTNGPTDWITKTGWEETLDECLWYSQPSNGTSMCNSDVLQSLEFAGNGLSGELPPELSMLTGMTKLSIKGVEGESGLEGGVPDTLATLTGLNELTLEYHKFKEGIPSGLFDAWGAAKVVNIANCNVPGMFPDLSALKALTNLNLSGNRLRGVFPDAATSLTTLEQFNIGDNKLNGPLPMKGLDSLTALKFFSAAGNAFTGPIPSALGTLVSLKAGLDLSQNQLNGKVPTTLNNLVNLQRLRLSFNMLTGTVPDLSGLTKLRELAIEGNELTGTVSKSTCAALTKAQASADCNPDGSGEVVCACCTTCCVTTTDGVCQSVR